ncbi:hypothetical protein IKG64_01090 [Candidatus Saccharibacteria bacterium]|nr:hypothetical protein [Candidatus Saccharibacteria bacterium]
MKYRLNNWYFDVSGDSSMDFGAYKAFMQSFRTFINCPADGMSVSNSCSLVLVGDVLYGGKTSINGISLITKVSVEADNDNISNGFDDKLTVLTSSGDVYHLFMADMNAKFYREFIRGEKVIHLGYAVSL